MACERCASEPYSGELCRSCFLAHIERRIRKDLRMNALISKGDTLILTDPLCRRVIEDIVQGMPLTITDDGGAPGKRVLPWTMDDEICYFLKRFLAGEEYPELGHGKAIKLFLTVREKELEAFAKAKGLPFTPRPRDRFRALIDNLEARHPETRFSLAKSIEEIRGIVRTKTI